MKCAANEYVVVPDLNDESTWHCGTACPGDWLTDVDEQGSWCFKPPSGGAATPEPVPSGPSRGKSYIGIAAVVLLVSGVFYVSIGKKR